MEVLLDILWGINHKTLKHLMQQYYWPSMAIEVMKYVDGCHIRQVTRCKQQNIGKNQFLPVPNKPQ